MQYQVPGGKADSLLFRPFSSFKSFIDLQEGNVKPHSSVKPQPKHDRGHPITSYSDMIAGEMDFDSK